MVRKERFKMNPVIKLDELIGKDFPEQGWIVDKLVQEASMTIVSAPAGSYKTYACLDIALAVAGNKSLFGQFDVKQCNVMFIDEESGERLLQQRVLQLNADKDVPLYFRSYEGFNVDEKSMKLLLEDCKVYDIKLVFLDSLTRIHGKDENSAGEMSAVFKFLRVLTTEGIAVVVIHHNRKPGVKRGSAGNEMRGSSDILAAVDCHIALNRDGNRVTVSQTKQRYAPEIKPFDLLVNSSEYSFTFEYKGEESFKTSADEAFKKELVNLIELNGELCQKDLLVLLDEAEIPTNEHKLREAVNKMLEEGVLLPVKGDGNTKYLRLASPINPITENELT
jgi:hypothetical protein